MPLDKQAWRIYTQLDLLVSNIYKAKYCHNSDMLYCSVGYKPSYFWRSIVKGFELLRTGSNQDQNGNIRWTANSSGSFELRSAYKLMTRLHGMDSSQEIGCSDYSQRQKFWQAYWKMTVPRKVNFFGWRGFHDAFPTGISLHKHGFHIFLHCWFARATWEQLGITELSRLPEAASFTDIIHYRWSQFMCRKRQLVLVTLWLLWYNRNKLKHGESGYSLNELVYRATNQSSSFEQNESKYLSSMRFLYISEFDWKKPPAGFIKINCDASLKDSVGGGIGIVAGTVIVILWLLELLKKADIHSSVNCEGLGLMESFRMAENLKADRVIFESDCAEVVKWFNICPDTRVAQEDWFKISMQMLHRHMEWKIVLIRREANVVAYLLAKRVTNLNWCWTRLDCCP